MTPFSKIYAEYKPYMDSDGLVHPVINPERGHTQNGIRWSSEAAVTMFKYPESKLLDQKDVRTWFITTINKCRVPNYLGLYDRTPARRGDQEGPDDYMCLVGACYTLGIASTPKDILEYGRSKTYRLKEMKLEEGEYYKLLVLLQKLFGFVQVRYNYNNANPDTLTPSSWMGRFPALICALKYAAGEKPTAFEKFWMLGCILLAVFTKDKGGQDGWVLQWFLNQTLTGKSWYFTLALKLWNRKLFKIHPGGIRAVLLSYFGNPDYPTCKYFPG